MVCQPPRLSPIVSSGRVSVDLLPPEILSQIFWYLSRLVDDIHTPVPPWAVVLHVSHRWREVSLGYADIWTFVPLGNTQWTELALRLSQPYSIHIQFPDPMLPRHQEPIYAAMKHCDRARSLDMRLGHANITIPNEAFEDIAFQALLDRPPARLMSFSLSHFSYPGKEAILYEDTFLASSQVQRLRLTRCLLPTKFAFPCTLVSLLLEFSILDHWTLRDVTDLLSTLPLLEELALMALTFEDNISELISTSNITPTLLPHIKTLHIITEADFMAAYMLLLDIPVHPGSTLRITCIDSPWERGVIWPGRIDLEHSCAVLFPLLAKHVRAAASREALQVQFFQDADSESSIHVLVAAGGIVISCRVPSSPSTLVGLLPESARYAVLRCEALPPEIILLAAISRTSPYLKRIILPNMSSISSGSLFADTEGHATRNLSKMRELEVVFTESHDMTDGGSASMFPVLLILLQETAATVIFDGGLELEEQQRTMVERDYPARVWEL